MARAMIPAKGELSDVLAEIPKVGRSYMREGFRLIAALPQEKYADLLTVALSAISTDLPSDVEVERLGSLLGITTDDVPEIMSSISLLSGVLAARTDTPEAFVTAAVKAELLRQADAPKV